MIKSDYKESRDILQAGGFLGAREASPTTQSWCISSCCFLSICVRGSRKRLTLTVARLERYFRWVYLVPDRALFGPFVKIRHEKLVIFSLVFVWLIRRHRRNQQSELVLTH